MQWYVEYQVKHPETREWQRFRKVISTKLHTGTARREAAAAIILRINNWLKDGGTPYSDEMVKLKTTMDALNFILEFKRVVCRKRTYYTYKNVITVFRKFLKQRGSDKITLDEMNSRIAQEFMDWSKIIHGISNRTHNYYLSHMNTFFNDLVRRHYMDRNPFSNIRKLETEETSIIAFTTSELNLLHTKLRQEDKLLWIVSGLIYYCALRPAELMRLRIGDLLLEEGRIRISGSQSKNKRGALVMIPNLEFLEDLCSMGYHLYPPDYFIFSKNLKPGEKETAPTRIAGRWRKWANDNKLARNIYDLKHTAAGMASDRGVNLRDLQLHYRHSALSITELYLNRCKRMPGPSLSRYPSM